MKKYFFASFWTVYMLFFAIPFPMLLYYNINNEFDINALNDKNPWMALGILAFSIILWTILLFGYFKRWIAQIFITKKNLEAIKENGVRREAKIINARIISKQNAEFNTYELDLLFKNLSDTEITHKTIITDSKPYERRFETGKKLNLLLNKNTKQLPYFIISTTQAKLNIPNLILRILGWLIAVILVMGYYFYSYKTESQGMGWRFMSFGHPLIICPMVLLFYRFILRFIISKFTGLNPDSVLIKFKGIKTPARLIKVSQTGTYINEQPMMRFELEYTDNQHRIHKNTLKKVIGLLDLDTTKQKEIDIFYLPENPIQIAFASDLENIV
ncbi:hypothetical protein [Flavobacterium phragmitis]|uniref:Transmembrane protein n=1 Tax=Flavobacterium phragmitis TaxID=739143 RepID=A0A1I1X3K7_9FLAO|nr:hypothetical protein [Flavobacterium phragmitis]SFE01932.1 hypothetical protein SAMN05216297_11840 [Flavobacterium phragmitis]